MEERRKKGHPFELNGGRGWIMTLGLFLIIQFGSALWWASGVTHDVINIKENVVSLKEYVKEEVRENRIAIKDLLKR